MVRVRHASPDYRETWRAATPRFAAATTGPRADAPPARATAAASPAGRASGGALGATRPGQRRPPDSAPGRHADALRGSSSTARAPVPSPSPHRLAGRQAARNPFPLRQGHRPRRPAMDRRRHAAVPAEHVIDRFEISLECRADRPVPCPLDDTAATAPDAPLRSVVLFAYATTPMMALRRPSEFTGFLFTCLYASAGVMARRSCQRRESRQAHRGRASSRARVATRRAPS